MKINQFDVVVYRGHAYAVCCFDVGFPMLNESGFDFVEPLKMNTYWTRHPDRMFCLTPNLSVPQNLFYI